MCFWLRNVNFWVGLQKYFIIAALYYGSIQRTVARVLLSGLESLHLSVPVRASTPKPSTIYWMLQTHHVQGHWRERGNEKKKYQNERRALKRTVSPCLLWYLHLINFWRQHWCILHWLSYPTMLCIFCDNWAKDGIWKICLLVTFSTFDVNSSKKLALW